LKTRVLKQIAFLLLVSNLATINSTRAQESVECRPNQYFERGDGADASITEFVMSLEESDCPTHRAGHRPEFSMPAYKELFFWMRLQGTYDYANTWHSGARIDLRIFKVNDDTPLFYDAIGMGRINLEEAKAEALLAEGKFDWRLSAWKTVFYRPGLYEVAIFQGKRRICVTDPSASNCVVRFTVR